MEFLELLSFIIMLVFAFLAFTYIYNIIISAFELTKLADLFVLCCSSSIISHFMIKSWFQFVCLQLGHCPPFPPRGLPPPPTTYNSNSSTNSSRCRRRRCRVGTTAGATRQFHVTTASDFPRRRCRRVTPRVSDSRHRHYRFVTTASDSRHRRCRRVTTASDSRVCQCRVRTPRKYRQNQTAQTVRR